MSAAYLSVDERPRSLDAAFDAIGWSVRFGPGTTVFSENQPVEHAYLVTSGAVRTVRMLSDGRRQVGAFHLPGDVFSLEADGVHKFNAEALAPSELRFAKHHALITRARADPDLNFELRATLASELRRADEHIFRLGQKTAEERLMSFLLDMSARASSKELVELPMTSTGRSGLSRPGDRDGLAHSYAPGGERGDRDTKQSQDRPQKPIHAVNAVAGLMCIKIERRVGNNGRTISPPSEHHQTAALTAARRSPR